MILCADVGATKTLLGLADVDAATGRVVVKASERYVAAQVPSFEAMLTDFLSKHGPSFGQPLRAAGLGVAGPVRDQTVQMTNLPWRLDARALSQHLGGVPVTLVNDFEAAAHGIEALGADELMTLQDGDADPQGNQLVIGAGSGLGVAFRIWQGGGHGVVPGEGGHYSFAPINEQQDLALQRLRPLVPRVVVEHFVSGPGLVNFYQCLGDEPPTKVFTPMDTDGLTGEGVFRKATQEGDARAQQALEQFLLAYGSVAGDYALATLARGGVYVAGGVAQRCGEMMRDGRFLRGFGQKGPYAELMARIPVHLVLQSELGLVGAAVAGARLLQA
ncbi:MAG TPA: glucokinase [Candidatus Aquabacterium excrementipullorum]|nr:glucokinase [Candidatus Aquabacterium excrementipullorum]